MAFTDNPLKKTSSMSTDDDMSVMKSSKDFTDSIIDDELPSVNRRKGKSKLIDSLGFAALLLSGMAMMYYVNADTEKKIVSTPVKKEVANFLPPLEITEPPPPPPEVIVPAPAAAPIPIKNSSQNKKTDGPTWSDRKMAGSVVIKASGGNTGNVDGKNDTALINTAAAAEDRSPLGLKLKSTVSQGVSASMLPNRDYLITKGTALDCALETAIDSTVPGLTTCRLTRDVYSDNGHVILLDRGSQLVGEYQGGITAGQARIFVLWTRAKTPNGVIVNLDSPGTDTLGRSGHEGWVDRHFMERFGAAIILSLVKDSLSYARAVQASKNGGSTVTIGGENSDQIATEILKNTVNIPPTLYVNQGEHIQVMVARDLDFSTVYGLELKE